MTSMLFGWFINRLVSLYLQIVNIGFEISKNQLSYWISSKIPIFKHKIHCFSYANLIKSTIYCFMICSRHLSIISYRKHSFIFNILFIIAIIMDIIWNFDFRAAILKKGGHLGLEGWSHLCLWINLNFGP